MSCARFDPDVALYAGDDLPPARRRRLEAHLAQCSNCRALLEELTGQRTLLAGLGADANEDARLAVLHNRVMAQVSAAPARRRPALIPLLALAAAILLTVILAWPRHSVEHRQPARIATRQPAAPVEQAPPVVPAVHKAVRRHRRRKPAAEPGPPLLVQFVTDDPNIVVYWLVDRKGD